MTLFSKIKWILGIVMIFVLVLATNLIDRQNFMIVNDAMESIYADRLVAQDIIHDLYQAVHDKEMAYLRQDMNGAPQGQEAINSRLQSHITRFATTKLTPGEAGTFGLLKKEVALLKGYESNGESGKIPPNGIPKAIQEIKRHLADLAKVQMDEGRRELYESKKAIQSADLFTQLEIAALIIMAVLIQIIILYTPKVDPAA